MQPHAELGGSDHALLRLVRSLPRDEFEVHIALPGPSPLAAEFSAAGATLHVVPMRRLSTSHGAVGWANYVARWPISVGRLTRLARRLHVDVVHSNSLHSWYGWAVAALIRRPHVWHAREVVVQSGTALSVERFLCRRFATRVIAVSNAVAAQLDPANVVVLDEFLDPHEFRPENAGRFRGRVDAPDDAPVVGAIARLDPLKGLDSLIDAFAEVRRVRPSARLLIVGGVVSGQERYREELRARAARDATMLLDARDDIPELVADLDVLALPSIEPESYGLVLVEALASGVPIVTTNHGGPPELVARAEPGAARLVEPGDVDALAGALLELLPATTSTADRRARRRLLEVPAPQFAETFRSAVASRRPGRQAGN